MPNSELPRAEELRKLKSRLRKDHFAMVSGAPDVGKTQFVKDLKRDLEYERINNKWVYDKYMGKAGMRWKAAYVAMERDASPYDLLTEALAGPESTILIPDGDKITPTFEIEVEEQLRQDGNGGLRDLYESSVLLRDFNLLVILDQFETLISSPEVDLKEKQNFVEMVLNASLDNQTIYVVICWRAPKNERWKQDFHDLALAYKKTNFKIFTLDQENLSKAVARYFQEASIDYQAKRHPERTEFEPLLIKPQPQKELVEKLYHTSKPMAKMREVINDDFISTSSMKPAKIKRKVEQPKRVATPAGAYGGGGGAGGQGGDDSGMHPLAKSAEDTYNGFTMLQKRVTRLIFDVLATLPDEGSLAGKISTSELVERVGRFKSIVPEVVQKFKDRGIFYADNEGVRLNELALYALWERLREWIEGKREVPPVPPSLQKAYSGPIMSGGGGSFAPAAGTSATAPDNTAEGVYQHLTLVEKRVARMLFELLAGLPAEGGGEIPGSLDLAEINSRIGKFVSLIPVVTHKFRQAGVLQADPAGMIDQKSKIRMDNFGICITWNRLHDWMHKANIDIPASAQKQADATPQNAPQAMAPPPPPSAQGGGGMARSAVAAVQAPTTGGPEAMAEATYQSLTMIQKRGAGKIFVYLGQNEGYQPVNEMLSNIGRLQSVLPFVAEAFRKAGILETEDGAAVSPGSSKIQLKETKLSEDWPRMQKWLAEA